MNNLINKSIMFINLALSLQTGCSLGTSLSERPEEVLVVSWNVQNIFDDEFTGTEYDEFNPNNGEWNRELYRLRLERAAETLDALNADIVALMEVENGNVLKDLNNELKRYFPYRFVTEAPGQAIQLGLLSRYPIVETHILQPEGSLKRQQRPIAECRIKIKDMELVLFLNHWKSRSGGVLATEELRIESARTLSARISEILREKNDAEIIVSGDLNENHDEFKRQGGYYRTALSIKGEDTLSGDSYLYVTGSKEDAALTEDGVVLYSPWYSKRGEGSYYYNESWETIDHFLISNGLFDRKGLYVNTFEVAGLPFLLNKEGYPKRFMAYSREGYSDHLPITLQIKAYQ